MYTVALDASEEEKISQFILKTCGCSFFNGTSCSAAFTYENIKQMRADCQGLNHSSLDYVVMGQIIANTTNSSQSLIAGTTTTERKKTYSKFYHRGIRVN